jgi:DNA-binding transcriptional LysR family regulator
MDIADLRLFETVARLGGMNRAAAELNTVQSNVTARVKALEEELGAALFERHSARVVTLTAAGHRLMPYAARARPAPGRGAPGLPRRRQRPEAGR